MSSVVSFKERLKERDNEEGLLKLIESDIEKGQNIEKIPEEIFGMMSVIEARAQAAREKRELMEG